VIFVMAFLSHIHGPTTIPMLCDKKAIDLQQRMEYTRGIVSYIKRI
jgi:hypothetical protein